MSKFLVTAIRTTVCQFEVEAETEKQAYDSLDGWIADDFEQYVVDNKWDYDFEKVEETVDA